MILLDNRLKAFVLLGKFLGQFKSQEKLKDCEALNKLFFDEFNELTDIVNVHNGWFTKDNVKEAVFEVSQMLNENALVDWISEYVSVINKVVDSKRVVVIMAGNIPMVGFHDLLCVLLSGHKLVCKLSTDDDKLIPYLCKVLFEIEEGFKDQVEFSDRIIKNIEAVIATGSDNSSVYFDYYYSKYPSIIRKNRNSLAVLTGLETTKELNLLGKDIFQYFGLGCRSVSKLFVPENYKFDLFYESIFDNKEIIQNNKYANNYEYNRTVYLMNTANDMLDNNFLILKKDASFSSPIGVLFFEYYKNIEDVVKLLDEKNDQLQCVVSNSAEISNSFPFGGSQCPALSDYADGIDTMRFLVTL